MIAPCFKRHYYFVRIIGKYICYYNFSIKTFNPRYIQSNNDYIHSWTVYSVATVPFCGTVAKPQSACAAQMRCTIATNFQQFESYQLKTTSSFENILFVSVFSPAFSAFASVGSSFTMLSAACRAIFKISISEKASAILSSGRPC